MKSPPHSLLHGYLLAILAMCIWTGFMLVARIGGLSPLTPYDIIALRYGVAGTIFLGVWLYKPFPLFTKQHISIALTGGFLYVLFVFIGFTFSPVSHASILLPGGFPFMTAVFAYAILKEIPSIHRRTGLAIIAAGMAFLAAENLNLQGDTIRGDILFLLGSACWCLYSVLLKKWHIAPFRAAIAVTLLTALLYLPIYALFLPKNWQQAQFNDIALPALYQGILVGCVQMLLYVKSINILGPSRMGMIMACVPALASILAVPLLGEPLSYGLVIGLVLVSFGAYWGNRQPSKQKRADPPPPSP